MKMEQLENGCLKIWLDEPDMQEMGLRFEEMDYRNAATREAVARLLETAREQTGFEAPDGLLVEVLPLDKGCLILMTPGRAAPAAAPSERRRFRMVRAGGPFVYAVEGVDQLFQLCAGLKRFRRTGGGRPRGRARSLNQTFFAKAFFQESRQESRQKSP